MNVAGIMIGPSSQISKLLVSLLFLLIIFFGYMDVHLYLRMQGYPIERNYHSNGTLPAALLMGLDSYSTQQPSPPSLVTSISSSSRHLHKPMIIFYRWVIDFWLESENFLLSFNFFFYFSNCCVINTFLIHEIELPLTILIPRLWYQANNNNFKIIFNYLDMLSSATLKSFLFCCWVNRD